MKTVIFVCHGNICRSPAAEYIMKYLLTRYSIDDQFIVFSRATSREEIGNDIYPPMQMALDEYNIPYDRHYATQITQEDYDKADYIFYMDENNRKWLSFIINDKRDIVKPITFYSQNISSIEDPWYYGQFDDVVDQIYRCVEDIILNIK